MHTVRPLIREVQDFPRAGVRFYDVTPVLAEAPAFARVIDMFASRYAVEQVDKIVGIESRGFIFGAALALQLGCGFVPLRKPGKLPRPAHAQPYSLEYGTSTLHIHQDALQPGERVVIVDDIIATGGTAVAAATLVARCGARLLEMAVVIELPALGGRQALAGSLYSLLTY